MKIAIIGVTGNVGRRILAEALSRGHTVTGIARDISKVAPQVGLTLVSGDVNMSGALAPLLAGHDAVVSSIHFSASDPKEYFKEASLGKAFLDLLRSVTDLDWTMLSPSALFIAGERTGVFRLGDDTLLTAADGKSWISYEDFSIALLDEIEAPKHIKSRFTIGY
jgi:putative NADH-flavin reductase